MFADIYREKRVLVTGHTGFKGSWLALWLQKLGAEVCGYALPPPTDPSHWDLLALDMRSEIADIRDAERLNAVFKSFRPEIVFHLAAQPLVRKSYNNPDETFETNVLGTVRVLDACRACDSLQAVVNVTSDKCYENREWIWGYRENDPMGGHDPYSASKGCAELVANAYRQSYFNPASYGDRHKQLLASCRAGNVIGGGDWAQDRLVPDIIRGAAQGKVTEIRSPEATRPWQHVLEPLSGYLQLGQRLFEGDTKVAEGWNFGPMDEAVITVREATELIQQMWDRIRCEMKPGNADLHEANLLKLDCSKAHARLGWRSVWDAVTTFQRTINWYRCWYESGNVQSLDDLKSYVHDANGVGAIWTRS